MVKSVAYSTSLLFFFLHLCSSLSLCLSLPVIVFLANVVTVVAVVVGWSSTWSLVTSCRVVAMRR